MGRTLIFCVNLLGKLPLSIRIAIGRACGFLFSFLPTKDRRIAKLQLDIFCSDCGGQSVPRVYAHVGQTALESLNLEPYLHNADHYVYCSTWDKVEAAIASKRGIVFLSAHTSNWDLLAAYIISKGLPLTTVAREAHNSYLNELLINIRKKYGIETAWRSEQSGTKQLLRRLREGGAIAGLIDQDTKVSSIPISFLGASAQTPSGLALLAKRCDAVILTAFIFRSALMKYVAYFEPIDSSLSLEEILTEYNRRLGEHLKQFPTQWVWFHKRWRTMPDGKRLSSIQYVDYLTEIVSRRGAHELQ